MFRLLVQRRRQAAVFGFGFVCCFVLLTTWNYRTPVLRSVSPANASAIPRIAPVSQRSPKTTPSIATTRSSIRTTQKSPPPPPPTTTRRATTTPPIVNPHDFKYIINNENLCVTPKPLKYIIYVHSAPTNGHKRKHLRDTWGAQNIFKDFSTRIVFLLAGVKDANTQNKIYQESIAYKDIVQENFLDAYKNLTYKGIMGLKWVSTYCKNAQYVIKSDDDTFLNIFEWLKLLDNQSSHQRSITCAVWTTMPILRDPKTCMKWCVKYSELPGKFFPRYCSGLTYTFTADLISDLYQQSLRTPFFWVDDVYITGLLPRSLRNVTYINVGGKYNLNKKVVLDNYKDRSSPLKAFATMAIDEIPKLWTETLGRLEDKQVADLSFDFQRKYADMFTRPTSPAPTSTVTKQKPYYNVNTGGVSSP